MQSPRRPSSTVPDSGLSPRRPDFPWETPQDHVAERVHAIILFLRVDVSRK